MDDTEACGYADVVLQSDCEPALLAVQEAIGRARKHSTIPENSPAYTPQTNGVAERAVQEVTAQLRCLKLGLESRIEVPILHFWRVTDSMVQHAGCLINRCLGADGRTPLKRLKGYEPNKPMVEFGEQVWAKPL